MSSNSPPVPASPDRPAAAGAAFELLAFSPAATLLLDEHGGVLWGNGALSALLGHDLAQRHGQRVDVALGLAPPAALALLEALAQPEATLDLALAPGCRPAWLRCAQRRLPDRRHLLVLSSLDELNEARAEAGRLAERLDVAQDFGRLGVWERDVRTLQGHWDRHVYRFWGLDPALDVPDFAEATMAIVESDRSALRQAFAASLRGAGNYSQRFRVRALDGSIRQLHSQWTVKNGADGQPERALGIMVDDTQVWALAQSRDDLQSQLALAVELSGLTVWRHDLSTGRVHYNAHGYRTLGLDPQPDGQPIEESRKLIHPDDLPRVLASAEASLQVAGASEMEARYRHADGSWRDVLTRRVLQRDSLGRPLAFLGVALDITDRVREGRRNAELARRFELAARTAGIGYWSLEGHAERATWSDQLRAMHGLARDAPVPGLPDWLRHHIHPDDRAEVRRRFADWVKSGRTSLEATFRILRSDGAVREVIAHSRVERDGRHPLLFGVVVDVTDRRSAAQALRQAAERAALAARGAGLGTWEVDVESGRAYWDVQMWRLRGLEPQDEPPTSEGRLALVHDEDRDEVRRLVEEAERGEQTAHFEFRIHLPDGGVRWLATRSAPVRDEAGHTVRRIGVNWDVTDRRTADAVRLEREVALRESQAKSKFLARMSHELRTPLNAVLGYAQLMLHDEDAARTAGAAAATRRQRLGVIRSAGSHLLSLIDDVLDLSSLEGGEMRIALAPVALAPLVDELLPLLEPLRCAHGVTVVTGVLDAVVLADATRMRQVLLNLLSNALKYNRDGGQVTIDALAQDGEVVLRVADTGRGMNEEQQRHLFEPFNRLGLEREGIQGTGIGLMIVKSLVERMGGSLRVVSTVGVGTLFELRLADGRSTPATRADAAEPAEPAEPAIWPAAAAPPAARRGCLLYIEDNPVNALIMVELVALRPGLQLHVAVDGASGLARATELRPDLILLDMHLPDFDGHEVLRRLRADPRTAAIQCIAVSANAMPEDIARALQAGVSDYWTKPLDLRAFMTTIDRLFGAAS